MCLEEKQWISHKNKKYQISSGILLFEFLYGIFFLQALDEQVCFTDIFSTVILIYVL